MTDAAASRVRHAAMHASHAGALRYAVLFLVAGARAGSAARDGARRLQDRSASCASIRSACRREWEWRNYWDILVGRALLAAAAELAGHRRADGGPDPRRRGDGRLRLRARPLLRLDASCFNYLLLGLMFPAATAILPLFIKIRDLGLLDTYWGVVLPQVAFGLAHEHPAVPQLLPPAARASCSTPRWSTAAAISASSGYVTLPLSRPILATVGSHRLRAQLEQLPAAAGRAQPRRASIPGRSASWSTRASTRPTGTWSSPSSR